MRYSPTAMHIPDGFLTPLVSAVGWVLALAALLVAVRQTRRQLGERQIPLMGVLAAFIFAAQAVNFPVAAGTSGHLLGGALAAIAMGPWAACLIMTSVIAVQGLVFQDGGLLVMGWNIVNMGVLTAFCGYLTYALFRRLVRDPRGARISGAFAGGWLSVEVGAMATALELAASGTSPLRLALPAMIGVHALIGIGEAIITTGAVLFLLASRPEVLEGAEVAPGRRSALLVAVGLTAALLAALFSPLASTSPDGLDAVARQQGILERAEAGPLSVLPNYVIPFVRHEALATLLAVLFGTFVVLGVALLVGRSTARRAERKE